ncbi:MAG: hypothetical protein KF868_19730 [Acidobacteria bacterium]|nr:hypothetical protein [Acidobacteriota bacterium]MCW5968849.1 hypothetical protein [Blastocatellales bacterium]
MVQSESIEITNETRVLDEPTLKAAHIKNKARIVVRENSILILPAERESQPAGDVIAESFGSFHLPQEAARYLAEDKEIE